MPLLSSTIFESGKLGLPNWLLATQLLVHSKNNASALEFKRYLRVSYPTSWLIKHKLMEVMTQREQRRWLTSNIEADDAYLGGERLGGEPGRSSENKVTFVAAVQTTESGKPLYAYLSCHRLLQLA